MEPDYYCQCCGARVRPSDDHPDGRVIPDYCETCTTKRRQATYTEIGAEIGNLVIQKNAAYGNSFGKSGDIMRILYPNGVPPEKLDDALTIVRIVDKLFRIATDRDALGESPWQDIAGYAILSVGRSKK